MEVETMTLELVKNAPVSKQKEAEKSKKEMILQLCKEGTK